MTEVFNLRADEKLYTMEELIANPELLPDGDVEAFVAAYAHYDCVKAGRFSGELIR